MMSRFVIVFILTIVVNQQLTGQTSFGVIEANRNMPITNSKIGAVINNPDVVNVNNYYQPDKILKEIAAKLDLMLNSQNKFEKRIERKMDSLRREGVKFKNEEDYLEKVNVISEVIIESKESSNSPESAHLFEKAEAIRNSTEALSKLKPQKVDANDYGYQISELKLNRNFLFQDDFTDEGIALVQYNNRCSFIDKRGKLLQPFIYELGTQNFAEGLAYVVTSFEGTHFVDTGFKRIVNTSKYDGVRPFRFGLSIVQAKNGLYDIIDKTGVSKLKKGQLRKIGNFNELGYAIIEDTMDLVNIIDTTCTPLLSEFCCQDVVYLKHVNRFKIKSNWNYSIYNPVTRKYSFNEKIINDIEIKEIGKIRENIIPVSDGKAWAYMRLDESIPFTRFEFQYADTFNRSRAIVTYQQSDLKSYYGLIDEFGVFIIPPFFLNLKYNNELGLYEIFVGKELKKGILYNKMVDIYIYINDKGVCVDGDCAFYKSKIEENRKKK